MILELQRLLRDKPSRQEIEIANNKLKQEFNDKVKELEQDFNDKLDDLYQKLTNNINNTNSKLALLQQELRALRQENAGKNIRDEINLLKNNVQNHTNEINENKKHILTIATAYGEVSGSQVSLDKTLEKSMKNSTNFITSNFADLRNSLSKLQSEVEKRIFDLSDLSPEPEFTADWRDSPDLPPVPKFEEIKETVEYTYKLIPRLQGFLKAMHEKIVDEDSQIDAEALDNLLKSLKEVVYSMKKDLTHIKRKVSDSLTPNDVIAMIREFALENFPDFSSTSVGAVHCIACGRETSQVKGALTEDEAFKRLGSPMNTLVLSDQQLYSSQETITKSGVESPHSVRTIRSSIKTRKLPK
ncbi:hypothetical protein GPJ56_005252 [Histomonas meleagridis]|uniref:uncharacterized protein n=1 Tax=Histomonas meleagridis TaxID=135588 RepID=UPI003559927C|nr:hypothetical protein GPJ56_005252 [Histomonas meleagridis]KAH0802102.1 hypothetical protein GO595_005183 [Histomonas meleagridis]